jgi:hypothetical protein
MRPRRNGSQAAVFVALWAAGHLGLPWLFPGEDVLAPFVFVLDLALILTLLTRVVVLPDEGAE